MVLETTDKLKSNYQSSFCFHSTTVTFNNNNNIYCSTVSLNNILEIIFQVLNSFFDVVRMEE